MTLTEALDIMIARTGHERYRWLCSDENNLPAPNDRDTFRQHIIVQAQIDPSLPNIDEHLREAQQSTGKKGCCGGTPLP
jgi:hypothetical protein